VSEIEVTWQDRVARITLNRPPLNILTASMLEAFTAGVTAAAEAHVLVIAASGRAFCAGVDIAEHLPEKAQAMLARFHGACRALAALDIPTIASVQGAALGGGCELVALCDFVIAARSATFGQPEITVGALPPVAVATLAGVVGPRRAMSMILLGEAISAEAAAEAGLVTTVVDDDHLAAATAQLVSKLSVLSQPALRLTKRAAQTVFRRQFQAALDDAERIYLHELVRTEDAREGVVAFLEKRRPVWKHR